MTCILHMIYRRFAILPLAIMAVFSSAVYGQSWIEEHAANVITPSFMEQTISRLASDSLQGRNTPSPGLDTAASFICRQFQAFGLKPLDGSYFQDLKFCTCDLDSNVFLAMVKDLETRNFRLKEDFIPYEFSGTRPAEGKIVFAGYGITAPEYDYDDYRDIDVEGKVVVILRQEPGQYDTAKSWFRGKELTWHSGLQEKLMTAREHGAAGVLVVSGPLHYSSLKPNGFRWPSLYNMPHSDTPLITYCGQRMKIIPMVAVGETVIRELFGSADTLKKLQQQIEQDRNPHSFLIPGKSIVMNVSMTEKPVGGRNVIGYLEGSDPELKKEAIVIGAHYDHLGYLTKHFPGTDSIFNGADDNASGTSGMLAIARAMTSMPEPPKRSVIFIAFAGEEKGLLGSATYVRDPRWPLEKTVAMLNLDMISRNAPERLEIIGSRQYPALAATLTRNTRKLGFTLAGGSEIPWDGGSDHYSFSKKGIPAVFLFTGLHQDYHKVTDSPDRVDAGKAARVARLAFLSAWNMANRHRYYTKGKTGKGGNSRGQDQQKARDDSSHDPYVDM